MFTSFKLKDVRMDIVMKFREQISEAALHKCSYKKVLWKYAANSASQFFIRENSLIKLEN